MVNWDLRTYTKDRFMAVWLRSDSIAACASELGLAKNGGTYKSLRSAAASLGLTESHMTRTEQYSVEGRRTTYSIKLSDLLVEDSTYSSTSGLRVRLIREGLLEPKCVGCGKSKEYNFISGTIDPINFHLDHINGINTDNRLENLRILCPTCHSFTPTYAGKNRNSVSPKACDCGSPIDRKSVTCLPCRAKKPTVLSTYDTEELIEGVISFGYLPYSKILGVSDNTIRKELKRRGQNLPKKSRGPSAKG